MERAAENAFVIQKMNLLGAAQKKAREWSDQASNALWVSNTSDTNAISYNAAILRGEP